jgi:type VI secretion system secreted protein VgrG
MKMNAMKLAIPLFVALTYGPSQGLAQSSILGAELGSFAVLGATTVTNTNPETNLPLGPTTITGNVGAWANPEAANDVTGLLATQVSGTIFEGPASGTTFQAVAQGQLTTAYTTLAGLTPNVVGGNLTGQNLGGLTLTSGVYKFDSEALLSGSGVLTLDAQGSADAFWVFQIGSALTTASSSLVDIVNDGGDNAPVFWQIGSSAVLGTDSEFLGNIVALTSITLTTRATIDCGSALARNGAVTMDTNTISIGCNNLAFTPPGEGDEGGGVVTVTPIPEPETYAMLLAGLGVMGFVARRRQRKLAAAA